MTANIDFYAGGKKEVMQAHVADLKQHKIRTLFDKVNGFYNMITGDVHFFKQNGKYYITASNVEKGIEYGYTLFKFDLETLKPKALDAGSAKTRDWVIDAEGNPIARSSFDYSSGKWIVEFKQGNRWAKVYEYIDKIDYPYLEGLGRDGKSVVVSFSSGPLDGYSVELDSEGNLSEPIEGTEKSSSLIFHPNTKRLCGLVTYDDWLDYTYFDPLLKKISEGAKSYFTGYRFRFHDFAEDLRKVLIYHEGPNNGGAYSFMDFTTGDDITVGENYPDIPSDWVVQKQKITYRAADDLEITAYLTLPPHSPDKNLPLVVMPHGGPQSRDRLNFDWEVEALASRGYAVLQPNYRGSSGYGDDFVEAGYGQWAKKMQTDLSDGVRHLANLGTIDPKRVAIYGASYGGYAALAGAAFDQGVYRCAISVAGPSDLKAMLDWVKSETGSSRSSAVLYWQRYWADVPLDTISPAKHVDAISIPILLIHGKNDTVVPIDQSRRMNKAMLAAKKDVKLIEFDKEDHWQSLAPARLEMIEAVMAFLDKHNPAFV